MIPTPFEKELGKALRSRFGKTTHVVRYADEEEKNSLYIVSGADFPTRGVTSYGSVGLYKKPQRVGDVSIEVEIVTACAAGTPSVANLVASCVFEAAKSGTKIVYGAYIPNIVRQYNISSTLHHVTFVSPFLWEDLHKVFVDSRPVYFLMMLPISDAELAYLEANGIDALERRFRDKQIDVFDIGRQSAVR